MRLRILLSVLTVGLVAYANTSQADEVTDLYFQQVIERYFEYPQNARTFGMAGSSWITARDSSSVYGNPAGLGWMSDGEFSGTYGYNTISGEEFPTGQDVSQEGGMGSALLAMPLGPTTNGLPYYGNIGLGWNYSEATWLDDTFDTETERQQVSLAYAIPVSDSVSLGYSLGWTEDDFQANRIFNYPMHAGFRHTLGALYKQSEELLIGSTLTIGHGEHRALYGPGIVDESDNLQVSFGIGAEYLMNSATAIAFTADYTNLDSNGELVSSIQPNIVGGDENGNLFNIRLGVEHDFNERLTGRAGYRYAGLASYKYNRVELNPLNGSAYYNAWSLGLGTSFPVSSHYVKQILLDYGVEYRAVGNDDWQHLVTISVPFEVCAPVES